MKALIPVLTAFLENRTSRKVMLGTAVLFVGVAILYKPREYFHEEVEDEHPIDPHGGG